MKICFLARPSFDRFSVALYKNMKSKNDDVEACFITTDKEETRYIVDNVDDAEVYETSTFIKKHKDECSLDKLIEFENRYDCVPIWKYIYTDRFLIHRDYKDVVTITVGLFMFFEEIFKNRRVDFYYSEAIATLQCYIAYIVGKKNGVIYVSQMHGRGSLDSAFHYFNCNEYMKNALFDENYLDVKYADVEVERAEKYLTDFEKNDRKPPSASMVKSFPTIDIQAFLSIGKRFIQSYNPRFNDPYSYMYYKSYKGYTDIWLRWWRYNRIKKYYKVPDYKKKYVYFPLHYQPEATTCVCAEKYEKQIYYIDSLAKSLPADTLLYVKEHYAGLGHRDISFYNEIKKYPNVVLVSPFESSRLLIDNAFVVTTLTGTAGFEAMLLRKPVILAGNMEYDNAPGIIKINDIYDNYLDCISKWEKPSREDVIKYLCATFRTYSKGNAYSQNYLELLEDNLDNLVDSLYRYLKRFEFKQ